MILTAAALGTWVGGLDKEGKLIAQLEASKDAFENFMLEKQSKEEGPDKKTAEQVTTICKQIIRTLKLRIEAQLIDIDLDQNNWLTPQEIKVRAPELH